MNNKMTIPLFVDECATEFIDWGALNETAADKPVAELRQMTKMYAIKLAKKRQLFYMRMLAVPVAIAVAPIAWYLVCVAPFK